jgi:hypothetical protein
VVQTVLGLVSIVAALLAWRSGNRRLIRIDAAALTIDAQTNLPGFFVRDAAFVKLISALVVLATVVAVMLILHRGPGPAAVTDTSAEIVLSAEPVAPPGEGAPTTRSIHRRRGSVGQ